MINENVIVKLKSFAEFAVNGLKNKRKKFAHKPVSIYKLFTFRWAKLLMKFNKFQSDSENF